MCVVLRVAFTLCFLGLALQGCQELGRRGQGSQHHGQSGTSAKYEETERKDVTGARNYREESMATD